MCVRLITGPKGNIEVEGKQNSLFSEKPVIKCFVIPPNSKLEKTAKKSFALLRMVYKFAAFSGPDHTRVENHVVVSLGS